MSESTVPRRALPVAVPAQQHAPPARSPVQPSVLAADPAGARRAERLSRVRGLLLGLALGDALTRFDRSEFGPLLSTATTQLACFTTEGMIRAMVRADHRGAAPAPSLLFLAYRRWAAGQGIPIPRPAPPSGWLHRVPALGEPRGDAPAVVAAVKATYEPTPAPASGVTRGHHALGPRLPLAAVPAPADWVREVVAVTHGEPDALRAAVAGVELARAVLQCGSVPDALRASGEPLLADVRVGRPSVAALAPDHSAVSALRGGAALAARCPDPAAVTRTLSSACELPVPSAAGPVAGALLGAAYGAEALPVELVSRLELAWAVDTLARDLVAQLEDRPGGGEGQRPADEHWWSRYPGG